jgi:DNA-binding FadR family transcriptional regulator
MSHLNLDSDILRYIIQHQVQPGERLPTLAELSQEMGVSVSKVREDLAVARTLGLVQIRPRTGIQVQAFDFEPTATLSVMYALGLDREYFYDFARLRKNIELSFWHEAVTQLTPEDFVTLRHLIRCAREKLNVVPIEVPFQEHRLLHLTFFKHLNNPFVQGILEAYWAAYKAFGLALFAELSYHREVWDYHERMVSCLERGDFEGSHRALSEHMTLLRYSPDQAEPGNTERASPSIYQHFE